MEGLDNPLETVYYMKEELRGIFETSKIIPTRIIQENLNFVDILKPCLPEQSQTRILPSYKI